MTFWGIPIISCMKQGSIIIGKSSLINSKNKGYHINMYAPCKFFVDKESATIEIGENCRIHGTCIHAQKRITIGDRCLIAANTNIFDTNGHLSSVNNPRQRLRKRDEPKEIVIGNDVWIGANTLIMKGVRIGNNVIVQAGSVIIPNSNFPDNSLIGGNPASIIKRWN